MYAIPFEVFKGQNQAIWADVYVPKNIPAGKYSGKLRVLVKGGVSEQIPIIVTVWDFTLPDGPTHSNHFGSFGFLTAQHIVTISVVSAILHDIFVLSEIQINSNKLKCAIARRCPSIV